ncbi:MAG: hypothetical protein QOG20_183 [Pseudonocardiales bacterium]|jgi:hypothetical protein|nr:hypothetical protein [Pseudonocardiales bacterium]
MTPPVGSISGAKRPDGDDATQGASTVEAPADADDCMVICVSRAVTPASSSISDPHGAMSDHRNPQPAYQCVVCPPLTFNASPVISLASSDARKSTALAMSVVRCIRPMGIPELHSSYASS